MSMQSAPYKCAHESCGCPVPQGQLYCSPHCADAATNPEIGIHAACRCGHQACADAREQGESTQRK